MSSNDLRKKLMSAKVDLENSKSNNEEEVFNFNFNIDDDSKVRYVPLETLEDAPTEWNFYKPLSNDKMTELLESIEKNGLLNPIIVWEINNDPSNPKYMILSGHNRTKAYKLLKAVTGSEEYNKILALIKKKEEITEEDAREIIIDTNWVQRQLSPMEKAKSVIEKYTVLQEKSDYKSNYNKYGEGRLRDIIADQYKISGRQVENYRNLQNLIPEIQELVSNNEISITPAFEIAKLDKNIQLWIYRNEINKINVRYTRQLRTNMTLDEVKEIFSNTTLDEKKTSISIKVPIKTYKKYKQLSQEDKCKFEEAVANIINKLMEKA